VSVVIPAYNAGKTLRRTIDSVVHQTHPAHEIIVVDDGSTDDTADIIHSYRDRIVPIRQENEGVSAARNKGISRATGEWIAFLDADDEWLPDKLKRQTDHLGRMPGLKWSFCNYYVKSETLQPKHSPRNISKAVHRPEVIESFFSALCLGISAWTGTIIIHRSVFETVGLFEPGMKRAQDSDLWFRVAYRYPTLGYLSEPLAVYHADTPFSSVKVNTDVASFQEMVRRHEKLSKELFREEEARPAIAQWIRYRMRILLKEKQYNGLRVLIDSVESYLPVRFRLEIRFVLLCPPLFSPIAESVHRIKGLIYR
jgi:glycosyltransferase involved in cell wall biosynthesis